MKETRVLVTGLWMGGSKPEYLIACNYDYSWLFQNPSILLWTDKIVVTSFIMKMIKDESCPDRPVISRTMKKVFEVADEHNLVEVRNPTGIITPKMYQVIDEEVDFDRSILEKLFPSHITSGKGKEVPGQIFVDGEEYCSPYLNSVYASLILAREWKAQCLFSEKALNYCKYKFGSSLVVDQRLGHPPNAFNTIFKSFFPEQRIFPEYVLASTQTDLCGKCKNEHKCSRGYLYELEENLSEYLELREYDEIVQIKSVLRDIVSRLESEKERVDHDAIIQEFKKKEREITKRIHSTFPKINRWSQLALISSVPITVVGIATGLPMVSALGAGIAGLSRIASEYIRHLESKYKWVGFISKNAPDLRRLH